MRSNELGQQIGPAVEGWVGATPPSAERMEGRLCRLVPLRAEEHAGALYEAFAADGEGRNWTYLPYGPFDSASAYAEQVERFERLPGTVFFAIEDRGSGRLAGVSAYLRIAPETGSIEVGHLCYAPSLQRTAASTEAMYLMMRRVFDDWGYRRYEWKCDALNAASRRAAERLGFRYEGTFRQLIDMKGRNRDTAWFSITDAEWPAIRRALENWLSPENFDEAGRQRRGLGEGMPSFAGAPLVLDLERVDD